MKFYLRKEESTVKTGSGSGFKCNTVSERSQKRVTRRLVLQIYTPRQTPEHQNTGARGLLYETKYLKEVTLWKKPAPFITRAGVRSQAGATHQNRYYPTVHCLSNVHCFPLGARFPLPQSQVRNRRYP